jgi:hypothetical protein
MIEECFAAAGYPETVTVVEETGPLLRVDEDKGTLTVHLSRMLVDEAPAEVIEAAALHELAHLHLGHPARWRRRKENQPRILVIGGAVIGFTSAIVASRMGPEASFISWFIIWFALAAVLFVGLAGVVFLVDVRKRGAEAFEADAQAAVWRGDGGAAMIATMRWMQEHCPIPRWMQFLNRLLPFPTVAVRIHRLQQA